MTFTVKTKIILGFSAILLIMMMVSINNLIKMDTISDTQARLTELRLPTEITTIELTDGIHLSLAGLRGFMILGDKPALAEKFKQERQDGWALIDQSIENMDYLSKTWTDPNNIKMLSEIKAHLSEFRIAQQEIEDIAHTAQDIPSLNLLITKAAPSAAKLLKEITDIINEEARLPATGERKELLKSLADFRGSFSIGLANIRAFLLTGDVQFSTNFKTTWRNNEVSFSALSNKRHLFNRAQAKAWDNLVTLRSEFAPLPNEMFTQRSNDDWKLSNYWLGTKAAPKAGAVMALLVKMRASQENLVSVDQAALMNETQSMRNLIVIATIIALLLGISISIVVSRMISAPLRLVVERAKSIGEGDLSGEALVVKGNDELTELTVAINTMSSSLKDTVKHIIDSSQQLGDSASLLSGVTQNTNRSIFEQQSQTEQVATAINEMSSTVQDVSANISNSALAAQDANKDTQQGKIMVDNAITAIEKLAKSIEGASAVILQLEHDSKEISSVIEVIRGVAEQTNLLALNAAIEAARAGEHGRGFAVVADEVRGLASRTQNSTEEINQVIEKLHIGSRRAVDTMTTSQAEAQAAVEQATKAGTSLGAISTAVERINDMSMQIASASEQQYATTEEINKSIINISKMANETTSGAKKTEHSSEELSSLAEALQQFSRHFKI